MSSAAPKTVPWWRTRLGEAEALAAAEAVRRGRLSLGALTEELERRLARVVDRPYVTVTASGTAALTMAYGACGVGPGDVVVVPDRTFIATAHAAQLLGARVVLADVLSEREVIDPASCERACRDGARVLAPVHRNGQACDLEALEAIARARGARIVEDACQALGSRDRGRPLGTRGDLACFSLGVTKLITCGQGGFVATADPVLHEAVRAWRSHGVVDPARAASFARFGHNFRATDIQAAIALAQLDRLEAKLAAHRALYRRYREALADVRCLSWPAVDLEGGEFPLWVEAHCPRREALVAFLVARDIQARPAPPSLSRSPHLAQAGAFPHAARFERTGLVLPCGPDQDPADIEQVFEAIRAFDREETR